MKNMEHLIANIQKFSVDDGPGIRTTVFFKGCPLRCIWCHNPECIPFSRTLFWNELTCAHCGNCVNTCPAGALSAEKEGIRIDRERCQSCGRCVQACPVEALSFNGKSMELEELYTVIMSDGIFYRTSGGGVTFSGGEPVLHADYLRPLLERLKESGVSVIFDTCGYVKWECFEAALPYASAFLYDIKGMDEAGHKENTGVPTGLIHENLKKLAERHAPLYIRLPVIQGANADEEQMARVAELIRPMDSVIEVDLLPYHSYGTSKYGRFGIPQSEKELSTPAREKLERYQKILEQSGHKVVIKS